MKKTYPYRPSNGSEGAGFMEHFCFKCKREAKYRVTAKAEDGCPIIADTFFYDVADPRYPKAWVMDDDGPRCTAFEPED